jgi:hypothetical protein
VSEDAAKELHHRCDLARRGVPSDPVEIRDLVDIISRLAGTLRDLCQVPITDGRRNHHHFRPVFQNANGRGEIIVADAERAGRRQIPSATR